MPTLGVTDIEQALAFWESIGFERWWKYPEQGEPTHVSVRFGMVSILIALVDPEANPIQKQSVYVVVENVIACHLRCSTTHPEETTDLDDYPYGMRDFSLTDPWGHFIVFGERLDRQPDASESEQAEPAKDNE